MRADCETAKPAFCELHVHVVFQTSNCASFDPGKVIAPQALRPSPADPLGRTSVVRHATSARRRRWVAYARRALRYVNG